MTSPPSPEPIEALMAGYALEDLDSQEIEQLKRLIAENPQLVIEINRLQETLELLPYALPTVEPPSRLRSAILEAASQPTERARLPNRFYWPWKAIAASVAAGLVLVLGLDNYRLRQALQGTQLQPSDTITYLLKETKSTFGASASITINPQNLKARLNVKNLPPLPPGKVYALWTVLSPDAPFTTDSKGAILTEVFEVDSQGKAARTISVPNVYRSQNWLSKIAVTIEDASSPQKHEGTPILITKL